MPLRGDEAILLDATSSLPIDQIITESWISASTIANETRPTTQVKDESVIIMTNFEEDCEDDSFADEGSSAFLTAAGFNELLFATA